MAVLIIVAVALLAGGDAGDDETIATDSGATSVDATDEVEVTSAATAPDFTLPNLTLPTGGSRAPLTVPDLTVPDTIVVPSAPVDDVPAPTEEPTGLGDDAELDDLAERCFDGGLIACDVLFAVSPAASDYERYGDTCGGRQSEGTRQYCSRMVFFPGPDWQQLSESAAAAPEFGEAVRCRAGDMSACDVVGTSSAAEELIDLGTSCAGRQDVGLGDCAGAFPEYEELLEPSGATGTPTATVPPATEEPTGLGDDAELDALAQSCYDGEMRACDDLYDAVDGEDPDAYRTYGDTCAGRQAEGTGTYCVATFGE